MAPAKILIVEDEAIVALDLQLRLQRWGYTVEAVYQGEDAIQVAQTMLPDLVLMDIQLPGAIDGIEVATILNERFGLPILYLTALGDPATYQRAQRTNPAGYLTKPFDESELQMTIEATLKQQSWLP